MKLILKRLHIRQVTTDGVLETEQGERYCDTAEYSPKMIPKGTYTVKLRKHPKYKYRAPYVQQSCGSNGSNGLRVSSGKLSAILPCNGVRTKSFGASINIGEHLAPGVVIKTRPYFARLLKRIEKAEKRGQEVILTIR